MKFNLKGVTPATWVRIIATILVAVNLIAVEVFNFQLLPFTDEEIYEGVSALVSVLVVFWVAWKNNSITAEAQEGDAYARRLKVGK